jgi:hypothetical protein
LRDIQFLVISPLKFLSYYSILSSCPVTSRTYIINQLGFCMSECHDVVSAREAVIRNDDVLSFIFMNWVDPRSCLAVCLVSRRFNALYRLRVPGPLRSSIAEHCCRVELVDWALGEGMEWTDAVCYKAAQGGHLAVLQWLRSQDPPCPWSALACSCAAGSGHLEVLQWLRSQDSPCPWSSSACDHASRSGHLAVLQWLRSQDPPCPWSSSACYLAAQNGHLAVLQWLRSQDPPCPWSELACAYAAGSGHLEVLQWLRSQDPPCPWSYLACYSAVRDGQLAVLQWLRSQDPPCPWDKSRILNVANNSTGATAHAVAEWVAAAPA